MGVACFGVCPRGSFSGCDRLVHRGVGEARDRLPWVHLVHQFGARAAVQGFDKGTRKDESGETRVH
ncbi:hypothetical protein GB937_006902 [Aspergillus fischeri]|nr:hypothetical protein GB937_006902 [Aspergillus fischeri]